MLGSGQESSITVQISCEKVSFVLFFSKVVILCAFDLIFLDKAILFCSYSTWSISEMLSRSLQSSMVMPFTHFLFTPPFAVNTLSKEKKKQKQQKLSKLLCFYAYFSVKMIFKNTQRVLPTRTLFCTLPPVGRNYKMVTHLKGKMRGKHCEVSFSKFKKYIFY